VTVRTTSSDAPPLDVRQPANWSGEPEVTEHWCLAHFILDGNHRVYAATAANTPARLLCFISLDASIVPSTRAVERVLTLLQSKN
jgi:hypothetical protein